MTFRTTRQVRLAAPGRVDVDQVDLPDRREGEVVVRTTAAGICGSDIHALAGRHPFIELPCYPGHEVVGVVEAADAGVSGFAIGDRVLVEPNLVCGHCQQCREGRYNICEDLAVFGCQTRGGMSDRFVIAADRLRPVPDGMSDAAAALAEPLATATHAVRLVGGDLTGQRVAVLGAGSIGLLTMLAASAAGATAIAVTDLLPAKLARARRLGATVTADGSGDIVGEVRAAFRGRVDVTFDCVATESSLRQAMGLCSKGGMVLVVGVPTRPVQLDLPLVQDHEISIQGVLMYTTEDVHRALDVLVDAWVPTEEIVTATFPLGEAAEAFDAARSGDHVKVHMTPGL